MTVKELTDRGLTEMQAKAIYLWIQEQRRNIRDGILTAQGIKGAPTAGFSTPTNLLDEQKLLDMFETARKMENPVDLVVEQIGKVASTILHCGDYGQCFWNAAEKKVWWTGGDSDFQTDLGYSDWDETLAAFKAIDGVEEVELADEYNPFDLDEDESPWIEVEYDQTRQRIFELEDIVQSTRERLTRMETEGTRFSASYVTGTREQLVQYEKQLAELKKAAIL